VGLGSRSLVSKGKGNRGRGWEEKLTCLVSLYLYLNCLVESANVLPLA